jgi:thiol-disulfide isomerase/thioredoxin
MNQPVDLYAGSTTAEIYRVREASVITQLGGLTVGSSLTLDVFRNQRYMPFTKAGFATKHLLRAERGPFSHDQGLPSPGYPPDPHDETKPYIVLPPGFQWASTCSLDGVCESADWVADANSAVDGDGWEYAVNWPQGLGAIKWKGKDERGCVVRRRRMVRAVTRVNAGNAVAATLVPVPAQTVASSTSQFATVVTPPAVITTAVIVGPSAGTSSAALCKLVGKQLQRAGQSKGEASAGILAGKRYLGLYYSAHWCPPCRAFTPQLAKWYTKHADKLGLQIVFVSSDRDVAGFDEYRRQMPWPALPFSERRLKDQLSSRHGVRGIPALIVLDQQGAVVTTDGRAGVASDPKAARFPWAAAGGPAGAGGAAAEEPSGLDKAGEVAGQAAKTAGRMLATGVAFSLAGRAVSKIL